MNSCNLAMSASSANNTDREDDYVIHSAKMSALGQLMAGLVHEINTPLAYIDATFSALGRQVVSLTDRLAGGVDPDIDPETQLLMSEIKILLVDGRHGVGQIYKLVTSLGNFSRFDNDKVQDVDLTAIMEDALRVAHNKLKYMDIIKNFRTIPPVSCSASKIMQVFLNIINNATQAIEQAEIEGKINISIAPADSDNVMIKIADNGPGMPKSAHEKIFEPFFTTKPPGQGTGLGLAICHRIVANHGGRIIVDPVPDEGMSFSITLPINGIQNASPPITGVE